MERLSANLKAYRFVKPKLRIAKPLAVIEINHTMKNTILKEESGYSVKESNDYYLNDLQRVENLSIEKEDHYNKTLLKWRYSRYTIYLKYSSLKKVINLTEAGLNWIFNVKKISNMPSYLRVEVSRKCSMNCLYCFMKKEDLFYPLEHYKKWIDKFKDYIFIVSLYEIGEPFENENIVEYIKYANDKDIGTIISSNLSLLKTDNFWKSIVLSGLDTLVIAIDGITQDVYEKYRRNGDLNLVLHNLSRILFFREKYDVKLRIEWQMIDFEWNKHEQLQTKKYAESLGCDFRLIQEAVKPRLKYRKSEFIRKKNCLLPYFSFNITAYNKVRSCTKIYNESMEIGDLNEESFESVWNGIEVQKIRDPKQIRNRLGCKTCLE